MILLNLINVNKNHEETLKTLASDIKSNIESVANSTRELGDFLEKESKIKSFSDVFAEAVKASASLYNMSKGFTEEMYGEMKKTLEFLRKELKNHSEYLKIWHRLRIKNDQDKQMSIYDRISTMNTEISETLGNIASMPKVILDCIMSKHQRIMESTENYFEFCRAAENYMKYFQQNYDEFIKTLQMSELKCCPGQGLVKKDIVTRKCKLAGKTYTLYFIRVRCKHCKKTHVILPDLIVPSRRLSYFDCRNILLGKFLENYSLFAVYNTRKVYKTSWAEALKTNRLDIRTESTTDFICKCYKIAQKCFLTGDNVKKVYLLNSP